MMEKTILLPSQSKIVSEEGSKGVYEIEGLYPGYGHTLGNSLRRIILSSLPGVAVVAVKIEGVSHEFSVIDGVAEDVVNIILRLKKLRFKTDLEGVQTLSVVKKGECVLTAGDFAQSNSSVEIINPDEVIANLTDKKSELNIEIMVQRGFGYVPKEQLKRDNLDVGAIALDAVFTPIRKVNYEVENMRVGDRTDFNRLRITIDTDGSWNPHDALKESINTMIQQLKAVIVGFKEDEVVESPSDSDVSESEAEKVDEGDQDLLKTKVDSLDMSTRTLNALSNANIKTIGGLIKKKESDLLEVDRLGEKGINEIKDILKGMDLELKAEK